MVNYSLGAIHARVLLTPVGHGAVQGVVGGEAGGLAVLGAVGLCHGGGFLLLPEGDVIVAHDLGIGVVRLRRITGREPGGNGRQRGDGGDAVHACPSPVVHGPEANPARAVGKAAPGSQARLAACQRSRMPRASFFAGSSASSWLSRRAVSSTT